jgi:hypothetical protein
VVHIVAQTWQLTLKLLVVVECVVVVRVVDVVVLTATVADLVGLDVGWVSVICVRLGGNVTITSFAHSRSELWVGGAT